MMLGGYEVTSSVEFGVRGLHVNGDHDKYRSDLNYKNGFRLFDSSFLLENKSAGENRAFDTAFLSATGWGADPSSSFRLNLDRTGLYKFESNVRRVRYFNNLKNHVPTWSQPVFTGSQHQYNTLHHFGDFDLTIFPERKFRYKAGYSFNNTEGPGTWTIRFPSSSSDEFQVNTNVATRSQDVRLGVEGQVLGFNLGLNYGHRWFSNDTRFFEGFDIGNNPVAGNALLTGGSRFYPVRGSTDYFNFFVQRTFNKKIDFTGRIVYAESQTESNESDIWTGRFSTTGNIITGDTYAVPGHAKRPQTRADLGITWRITDNFRLSNTFTFDQFNLSGSSLYSEILQQTTAAGAPVANVVNRAAFNTITAYRRFVNTFEGDYQVDNWLGFYIGYRYTNRSVELTGLRQLFSGSVNPDITGTDDNENSTNSIIAGVKVKPTRNWSIFGDIENGQSDNAFTRLGNNDIFNYRIRSLAAIKDFTVNVSFVAKNNQDIGTTAPAGSLPSFEAIAETNNRFFSASVDWLPHTFFGLTAGYTYNHLNSNADILVPINSAYVRGISQYFVRDSYFFFDVTVHPVKWVSVFASYRIDDDSGQGDRVTTRVQDIITSYPIRYQAPEVRVAIRLTKNIDWNLGYQYYDYRERVYPNPFATSSVSPSTFVPVVPAQNYNAHLPYTSLRIHWGGREDGTK
jgi:hypothetical protein